MTKKNNLEIDNITPNFVLKLQEKNILDSTPMLEHIGRSDFFLDGKKFDAISDYANVFGKDPDEVKKLNQLCNAPVYENAQTYISVNISQFLLDCVDILKAERGYTRAEVTEHIFTHFINDFYSRLDEFQKSTFHNEVSAKIKKWEEKKGKKK